MWYVWSRGARGVCGHDPRSAVRQNPARFASNARRGAARRGAVRMRLGILLHAGRRRPHVRALCQWCHTEARRFGNHGPSPSPTPSSVDHTLNVLPRRCTYPRCQGNVNTMQPCGAAGSQSAELEGSGCAPYQGKGPQQLGPGKAEQVRRCHGPGGGGKRTKAGMHGGGGKHG